MHIDLEQLDRELGFDVDPLDDLDDSAFIAMEFQDQATQVDPETLTRGDIHKLKDLLREHPAVDDILDTWVHDSDDQSAASALEALVETWGITPPDGRKAVSVSLEAVESYLGGCAWPRCREPRKQRQGPTKGRNPRHCAVHTGEAKRKADRDRLRLKRSGVLAVPECCSAWVKSGHRGKCQQHRDNEAARTLPYPLAAIEAAYLSDGFHLQGYSGRPVKMQADDC